MSNITEFQNVPDVSFIDNLDAQTVRDNLIEAYKAEVQNITGEQIDLASGAPERLMLYAFSAQLYQAYKYIDVSAKMGLLKYSQGDYLDNLGLLRGLKRKDATPASCTVEFTLSDIRASATGIAGGTRLKAGNIYFVTNEYLEIPAGQNKGQVTAVAEVAGIEGNTVAKGDIKTIVDPVAYVASVTNINDATGGTDIESDDKFTLRIYECPAGYSVAGPTDAYIFHAKNAISDIGDVYAYTPQPGNVEVVFTMSDGSLPQVEKIEQMGKALNDETIRPLTDTVTCKAPSEVEYSIDLVYYINTSDSAKAVSIQNAVTDAVTAYKQWQRHLKRDITASKLIQMIMSAGAKRVEVTAPTYTALQVDQIAKCTDVNITYGGLEND